MSDRVLLPDSIARCPTHIVELGDYYVTNRDEKIVTILGSCVCVCLADTQSGVAGMNHFMLPKPLGDTNFFYSNEGRFGINAMELLINAMAKLGGDRRKFWAKVFGGANVLEDMGFDSRLPNSNSEFAVKFLEAEGIPIQSKDLGGTLGRKVVLHSQSGSVFVRKMKRIRKPSAKISKTPKENSLVLFDDCSDVVDDVSVSNRQTFSKSNTSQNGYVRGDAEFVVAPMSVSEFNIFAALIEKRLGIRMPITKRHMLEARLLKRLRELKANTFEIYYHEFLKSSSSEQTYFFDLATTNKTSFLREPEHFEYLSKVALPDLLENLGAGVRKPIIGWSAGCSTGEESYTLAMVLAEYLNVNKLPQDFRIHSSDVSTKVLNKASKAIYLLDSIQPLPQHWRRKYLLKSKNGHQTRVKISSYLRERVIFHIQNLMDAEYSIRETFDFIFFRNVLIYFERARQQQILSKVCKRLANGGYLFVSHSESLHGLDLPVSSVGRSIYKKI